MIFNFSGGGQEWLVWWHPPRHCKMFPVWAGFMCLNLSLGPLSFSVWPRSLVRFFSLLLGRRNETERGGQRVLESGWAHVSWPHLGTFLSSSRKLTTSSFQFLGNLRLSLFFCLFYLPISLFKPLPLRSSKKMKGMKPKAAKWSVSLKKKKKRKICRAKVGFLKENVVWESG